MSQYGSIGQMDIQPDGYAGHEVYEQIAGWLNPAETEQPNGTNSLINDGVIRGQLGVGDMDSFELNLNAGEAVHIRVGRTTGNLAPRVWLYNPDGTLNETTWSGRVDRPVAGLECHSTSSTCALEQTGTYRVVVADHFGDRVGEYDIHYARMPQSNGIAPLVDDGAISEVITSGGMDSF
ncbi:hypothetical protein, partial [Ectothiorhodospira variabilis]|uniref:hypothetical protein n=1 Tax=Ectothiorhodospira variabilis TaxID=505694 RepID=UPI001EFABDE8